jgi:hypothetical protein
MIGATVGAQTAAKASWWEGRVGLMAARRARRHNFNLLLQVKDGIRRVKAGRSRFVTPDTGRE